MTRRPRSSSRRPRKPTKCCRMRRSARSTTSTVMRAWMRSAGGGGAGMNPGEAFGDIFGDVFGDIFGGARAWRALAGVPWRGSALRAGARSQPGRVRRRHRDRRAEAVRMRDLQGQRRCQGLQSRCSARPAMAAGQVRVSQGFFQLQQTCPRCRGSGKIVKNPCDTCLGQGRVRRTKKLSVKIPPGVDNGDRIRLSGEGEAGRNGGPAGDLYVEVHVRAHEIFEREGEHLSCEVPVSFVTAALGGTVIVPTLDGQVSLKIPAETQSGKVFRLRDKGVKPVRGGARGDLFCRVMVETPGQAFQRAEGSAEEIRGFAEVRRRSAHAARRRILRRREAVLHRTRRANVTSESAISVSRDASAPAGRMALAAARCRCARPEQTSAGCWRDSPACRSTASVTGSWQGVARASCRRSTSPAPRPWRQRRCLRGGRRAIDGRHHRA